MEKAGVAVGLATISVVLAAVVFAAENAHRPMQFIERTLVLFARWWRRFDGSSSRYSAGGNYQPGRIAAGDEVILAHRYGRDLSERMGPFATC
jgi:hypothetical protein